MDVWITRNKRVARCRYCEQDIKAGEPIVKGRLRRKGKWTVHMYWHPQCWVEQGIAEMERRTFVETRGRKKLPLTEEQRNIRLCLLRRKASLAYRMRKESDPDKLQHMMEMMENLRKEIEPVGGVPKGW